MKLKTALLAASLITFVTPAHSKSFIGRSPEWLAENVLAWAGPLQAKCVDQFFIRHTIFDLVWDIYELKSGSPMNKDEAATQKFNEQLEKIEAGYGAEWDCRSAYKAFGEHGSVLRGVMYPNKLDQQLSNPF